MLERSFTAYGIGQRIVKKGTATFEKGKDEEESDMNFLDALALIIGEDVLATEVLRITD